MGIVALKLLSRNFGSEVGIRREKWAWQGYIHCQVLLSTSPGSMLRSYLHSIGQHVIFQAGMDIQRATILVSSPKSCGDVKQQRPRCQEQK